jgi:hypothetical protein
LSACQKCSATTTTPHRTLRDRGIQHARKFHVQAELGAAVHLAGRIEPALRSSNQRVIRPGLELDVLRHLEFRGRLRELSIGEALTAVVLDAGAARPAALGRDAPLVGRRCDQQRARLRARGAQLFPGIGYAVAGAGDLAAVTGIDIRVADGRGDDPDGREVDLELLGEQHGQRGVHALSHFGAIDEDGNRVVGRDLEPGIELGRRRGARGACARAAGGSGVAPKSRHSHRQQQACAEPRRAAAEIAPAGVGGRSVGRRGGACLLPAGRGLHTPGALAPRLQEFLPGVRSWAAR